MDEKTLEIVEACKMVVRCYEDYENETMREPMTVVQACESLNCVLERVRTE
jgi:hypothetical protein